MAEMIEIQADEVIDAYLARPDAGVKIKGAMIVVHEVWGLNDHTKSVADRFAKEGYLALAPELLKVLDLDHDEAAQLQKDLFDPEKRTAVQPRLRELMSPIQEPDFAGKTTDRLEACFDYLYTMPDSAQKVAITGFCFGGSYAYALAVSEPSIKIALPFYGHADQSVSELTNIKCPVRAFFGKNDEALISKLPDLESRMKEAGVDFQTKVYDNCGHAFFNDTNPFTYNKDAADDAWSKVLEELSLVMG